MKASQLGIQIEREMPADADNLATAWLLRGGFMYRHAAGIYSFAPLMERVKRKIALIIEEEIEAAGGAQITLPILQSAEIWRDTGRWAIYEHEKLMFTLKDRRGRQFGLAPTAEETACELAKHLIKSASQLPLILFQQNTKFRDERRPRSGLLRGREFVMMDAYSFDLNEAGLDVAYTAMSRAFHRIFGRIGLRYNVVQADSGAIGGSASEEFMAISDSGEDTLLFCDGYAANLELASSLVPPASSFQDGEMAIVDTPNCRSIADVATLLKTAPSSVLKTVILDVIRHNGVSQVAFLIRGDCEANLLKLTNHFGALEVVMATPEKVEALCGCPPGFVGPIGFPKGIEVVADDSLAGMTSVVAGCNQVDRHAICVKPGRDFMLPDTHDFRLARVGETAPSGGVLQACRGIEVGHIFKLGLKYSQALKAGVMDDSQTFRHFQMGCYGIGTTRALATIVDQNCSEAGITWPIQIAPFHVHILPLGEHLAGAAKDLAAKLGVAGVESMIDDRRGTPGVKLKDSDILGFPFRIVLGRDYDKGLIELLNRADGTVSKVVPDEAVTIVAEHLRATTFSN